MANARRPGPGKPKVQVNGRRAEKSSSAPAITTAPTNAGTRVTPAISGPIGASLNSAKINVPSQPPTNPARTAPNQPPGNLPGTTASAAQPISPATMSVISSPTNPTVTHMPVP